MLADPAHDRFSACVSLGGDVERDVLGVVGDGVDVCSAGVLVFGRAALTAVAGLPERVVDLLGAGRSEPSNSSTRPVIPRAVACQAFHPGAAFDQQARHVPAATPHRIVKRRATADRGPLNSGAGVLRPEQKTRNSRLAGAGTSVPL